MNALITVGKTYSKTLAATGWLYLEQCDCIDSPERLVDFVSGTLGLGQVMEQYNRETIYNVRKQVGYERYSDSKSQNRIPLHTDGNYLQNPPRYLVLRCVRPAACGGGYTLIGDGMGFFQLLPQGAQQMLRSRHVDWSYPFGDGGSAEDCIQRPILDGSVGHQIVRYSDNCLRYGCSSPHQKATSRLRRDRFLKAICDSFTNFFWDNHVAIRMKANSLLIWNNHRMVHARTAYHDPSRHLQRLWLQ